MAKVDYRTLTKAERARLREELHLLYRQVGVSQEGERLLLALLTESEIVMLARRIQIARRLLRGDPFEHIGRELHVGTNTVHAVDEWLGQHLDAYRTVLPPLLRRSRRRPDPLSLKSLCRRYSWDMAFLKFLLGQP